MPMSPTNPEVSVAMRKAVKENPPGRQNRAPQKTWTTSRTDCQSVNLSTWSLNSTSTGRPKAQSLRGKSPIGLLRTAHATQASPKKTGSGRSLVSFGYDRLPIEDDLSRANSDGP